MSHRTLITSLALAALIGGGMAHGQAVQAQGTATAAMTAPDALVKSLSEDVLAAIRKDPTLQSGDIARLNALVDEKVLPPGVSSTERPCGARSSLPSRSGRPRGRGPRPSRRRRASCRRETWARH